MFRPSVRKIKKLGASYYFTTHPFHNITSTYFGILLTYNIDKDRNFIVAPLKVNNV